MLRCGAAAAVVATVVLSSAAAPGQETGRLVSLRSGAASAVAMDLGGGARDGRISRTLAGDHHAVIDVVPLPGRRCSSPVEWNARIVVGTNEGVVVRGSDGALRTVALGGAVDVRPVVLPSGELLLVTRDGRALVLGPDLEVRRQRRLGGAPRHGLLVLADGSAVIASDDRRLHRIDSTLAPIFSVPIPSGQAGMVHAPTFIPPDRLAVAAADRILLFDLSGELVRSVALGERSISAAVAAEDGSLHVLLVSGAIAVIEHGRSARRHPLGGRGMEDGTVLARDDDGSYRIAIATLGVLAVEPEGTIRWTVSADAPFHGPLAVDAAHKTLAFDRRGRLAVIGPDGARLELVDLRGVARGFPLIASDGSLWVTTDAAELVHVGSPPRPDP